MKEFRINDYISLKLENAKTNLYVKDELFNQCKFLLIHIPIERVSSFEDIDSVDEAAEKLDKSLEDDNQKGIIPPDVEFWGHCSNLQVWHESNYDTRLLHRNIAFPLLKKLTDVGDPLAKRVFKEEIISRYVRGFETVKEYLYEEGYLSYLNLEEIINGILKPEDANIMMDIALSSNIKYQLVRYLSEKKVRERIFLNVLYFSEKNGSLEALEVDINQFGHRLPEFLRGFKKLKTLKIFAQSNNVVVINLDINLNVLERLDIYIDGNIVISDKFHNFPNLYSLCIYGNNRTKLENGLESIGTLKNLEWLEFHSLSLKKLPSYLKRLKNLEWLMIDDTELEEDLDLSDVKFIENLIINGEKNNI